MVKDYMKSCTSCTCTKAMHHKPYGLLKQLPIPSQPWESISMDFIEQLPASEAPQSTESPASLDRPIGAIFECLIGSKRPVYTSQLQYSVKVATSSYTVQSKYMLVYPGSYM